jgi:ADP-heptose:LPS heptosyltransferase
MHIGAAFNKKIISIWGNTVPKFGMYPYQADPDSVQFEVDGLRCRPCSKIGYQQCPRKHFRCMMEQDIPGISQAAERLFKVIGQ